jgi:hypothetical protein
MTMTAIAHHVRFAAPLPAFLDDLQVAVATFRQRRADRAALVHAARLGPRLLADMGIEATVPRPAIGGWDHLQANGFLVQRRR